MATDDAVLSEKRIEMIVAEAMDNPFERSLRKRFDDAIRNALAEATPIIEAWVWRSASAFVDDYGDHKARDLNEDMLLEFDRRADVLIYGKRSGGNDEA